MNKKEVLSAETIEMFNAIKSMNINAFLKAVEHADINAVDCENKNALSILLTAKNYDDNKEKYKDYDKTSGKMIRIYKKLIEKNINLLSNSPLNFVEPELFETHLVSLIIKDSLNYLRKDPILLDHYFNDKGDKWLFIVIKEKDVDLLEAFIKEKKSSPAFILDSTDKSALLEAIDTRNTNIIDLFLSGINESNVNFYPFENFSLIDEVLLNAGNDSISKMPYYQKVVDDLLNKGAKLNENIKYGKCAEALILQNKIKEKPIQLLNNKI